MYRCPRCGSSDSLTRRFLVECVETITSDGEILETNYESTLTNTTYICEDCGYRFSEDPIDNRYNHLGFDTEAKPEDFRQSRLITKDIL